MKANEVVQKIHSDNSGFILLEYIYEEMVLKYSLSPRESDVLRHLIRGKTRADDLAELLGISRNTVRIHVKNINTKLGIHSKTEILARVIDHVSKAEVS